MSLVFFFSLPFFNRGMSVSVRGLAVWSQGSGFSDPESLGTSISHDTGKAVTHLIWS